MASLIINTTGVFIIALIVWWFFLYKRKTIKASNELIIKVHNGVYEPGIIEVKAGKPIELNFLRLDNSPCSEVVIFDGLDISATLPYNQPHKISIDTQQPGRYKFHCQMGMYRGELLID